MTSSLGQLATGRWDGVAARCSATFAVRNFGLRTVRGSVPVSSCSVEVDAAGTPTAVAATLDLTGIDTGNRTRNRDLQKPRLLDTANHPGLAFTGSAPVPTTAGWQVPGTLTGRASAHVTLDAEPVGRTARGELTVRATCTLDRRSLGVQAPRFLVGRYVTVHIEATFAPPQ